VRYILLIYGEEARWASLSQEQQQAEFAAYASFTQDLVDRGMMRAGEALEDSSKATTVRVRDGERLVTDGPFVETKEQVGGFYLIECESLDEAIDAAAKIPAARGGAIEVRPIAELPAEYPSPG
jgi:hypothetical protein